MISPTGSSLGDVSCRVTGYVIEQLRRRKIPTASLTQDLTPSVADLQSPAVAISWDDFLVFFRNCQRVLSEEQLFEVCRCYPTSALLRPFLSALGLWVAPARCFEWVADSRVGVLQQLFRCLETTFTLTNDREVCIEERLRPGYRPPPDAFWECQAVALRTLPRHLGMTDSRVTWRPIERGASFHIHLPRRSWLRSVLYWLSQWCQGIPSEDLLQVLTAAQERTLRLEHDLRERSREAAALAVSANRLTRITQTLPGIVFQYFRDPDGRQGFQYIGAGASRFSEHTSDEILAQPDLLWISLDPDQVAAFQQAIKESAEKGSPWTQVFRFKSRAGHTRWFRGQSIPEPPDATGRVVWTGLLLDITSERQAVEALRHSEERFRRMTENSAEVIFLTDSQTRCLYISPSVQQVLGYTTEEVLGQWTLSYCHPDDLALAQEKLATILADPATVVRVEIRVRCKNGSYKWLDVIATNQLHEPAVGAIVVNYRDITDRKETEAKLHARDELLRKLSEQVPGFIYQYQWWPDGRSCFPYASEGIRDIYEVTPAQVAESADQVFARLHPDDVSRVYASIQHSAATLQPWKCEYRVQLPQRGLRWLNGHSIPERQPDGSTLWHGYIHDVTDRKNIEDTLRESEERLSAVINYAPNVAIQWYDAEGRVLLWNNASERMFGYTASEAQGKTLDQLIHNSQEYAQFQQALASVAKSNQPIGPAEFRFHRKDGQTGISLSSLFQIPGSQGQRWFACMDVDITHRKQVESALREAEQHQRLALDAAQMGTWDWDIVGNQVILDARECELFGIDDAAQHPLPVDLCFARLHPDDVPVVQQEIAKCLETGKDYRANFRIRLPDNSIRWLHGRGLVLHDANGRPVRMVGVTYDITDRKLAEQALIEEKTFLRAIFDSLPGIIYTLDSEGRFLRWNHNFTTLLGWTKEEIAAMSALDLVHPADRERTAAAIAQVFQTGEATLELRLLTRAGEAIPYFCSGVRTPLGGKVYLIGFGIDISARLAAEEQIRASLRDKEALLKEIHHRVKNNLQIIYSLLSLQSARVAHPIALSVLTESQNRVRAMALVHETLYRTDNLAHVDLSGYIRELTGYLFRAYGVDGERIRLVVDMETVHVTPDRGIPCGLIVNELISNALKYAFPDNRSGRILIALHRSDDNRLTLSIEDDGIGLPADLVINQTPSLGLQLVYTLTQQLDGQLTIHRGNGTRFVLAFTL